MGYKAGAERAAEDYRCLTTVMPSIKLVQVSTSPQRKAARGVENGFMTTEVIVVESLMCFVPSLVHDDLLPLGFLLR
jgi:hypothetical protein